jgi:hypothetical protein
LGLRSENLASVGGLYAEDDFRQLIVTIEATPASLRGLGELEDHGERGLVRKTSLGADCAGDARSRTSFRLVGPRRCSAAKRVRRREMDVNHNELQVDRLQLEA